MNTGDAMVHRCNPKNCGTEKGMALVSALIVVSVAAGLFAAIMYFALTGTEISGLQRKYHSSKEASLGAIDVLTKDLLPTVMGGTNLSAAVSALVKPTAVMPAVTADSAKDACFTAKLTKGTSGWPGGTCDSGTDPTVNPDIVFNLKGKSDQTKPYVVNMKVIDTVTGNSDKSGVVLDLGSGVVDDASSLIRIQHFPFLYTIVTDARQQGSTTDRVNIEVLYAY
ncbi:MAG: pilX-2 [Deltaproteobacteria bacterium]|nr:pilX-2 [Deltaproteobacteria bacterium]